MTELEWSVATRAQSELPKAGCQILITSKNCTHLNKGKD